MPISKLILVTAAQPVTRSCTTITGARPIALDVSAGCTLRDCTCTTTATTDSVSLADVYMLICLASSSADLLVPWLVRYRVSAKAVSHFTVCVSYLCDTVYFGITVLLCSYAVVSLKYGESAVAVASRYSIRYPMIPITVLDRMGALWSVPSVGAIRRFIVIYCDRCHLYIIRRSSVDGSISLKPSIFPGTALTFVL